jgi:hypothetical protein
LIDWFKEKAPLNVETTNARCLLDFAYRNWNEQNPYAPHMPTSKLIDRERCCIVVFSILLKIGHGDLIHHFRSYDIYDSTLPIPLYVLKETLLRMIKYHQLRIDPDALAKEFDNEQWQFCPAKLENDEEHDFPKNRIIPIYKKEKINGKGGTATLWQIEVLEEFVHPSLREVVKTSRYENEEDQMGPVSHPIYNHLKRIVLLTFNSAIILL